MTQITTKKTKPSPEVSTKTKNSKTTKKDSGYCGSFAKLFVFVLVCSLASSSYTIRNYNYSDSKLLYKTDQYVISHWFSSFSTLLCKSYELNTFYNADAFLVNGEARSSQKWREVITLTERDVIKENDYAYHASHLIHGSSIHVKGCSILEMLPKAEVLVIKGNSNWESWKTGNCPITCVAKSIDIKAQETCNFMEIFDLEYDVTSDDNYYVVITKKADSGDQSTFIYSQLKLNKTVYDLSQTVRHCHQQQSCVLPLDFGKQQEIIVRIENDQSSSHLGSVRTQCQLRTIMLVGVFAILPASLILLAGLCCCMCYTMGKREAKINRKLQITKALVNNDKEKLPPSYDSITKIQASDSIA
ncbi:uncharacterized protein LOC126808652 isoform X2 [Patella vulgata]|nr:uncharacterized protein LOC126808652 isoform X2 [Patella vulgata]XP_050389518.1 uncharacterized protein LOC126808652 isoform X2 [Patella vulgata]